MVTVFWSGVFLSKDFLGVNSFPVFKLISGTLAMCFYLNFLLGFLNITLTEFFKQTIFRLITPIIIQVLFLLIAIEYLPDIKGKVNLLIVIGTGGIGSFLGFVTLYITSTYYRSEFNHYLSKILIRNK